MSASKKSNKITKRRRKKCFSDDPAGYERRKAKENEKEHVYNISIISKVSFGRVSCDLIWELLSMIRSMVYWSISNLHFYSARYVEFLNLVLFYFSGIFSLPTKHYLIRHSAFALICGSFK